MQPYDCDYGPYGPGDGGGPVVAAANPLAPTNPGAFGFPMGAEGNIIDPKDPFFAQVRGNNENLLPFDVVGGVGGDESWKFGGAAGGRVFRRSRGRFHFKPQPPSAQVGGVGLGRNFNHHSWGDWEWERSYATLPGEFFNANLRNLRHCNLVGANF